jgi:hypothetical protein
MYNMVIGTGSRGIDSVFSHCSCNVGLGFYEFACANKIVR